MEYIVHSWSVNVRDGCHIIMAFGNPRSDWLEASKQEKNNQTKIFLSVTYKWLFNLLWHDTKATGH